MDVLKLAFGSRKQSQFFLSPRETVRDIPSYRENGDFAKCIRGLKVELLELEVTYTNWRTILLSKLPHKVKDYIIGVIRVEAITMRSNNPF